MAKHPKKHAKSKPGVEQEYLRYFAPAPFVPLRADDVNDSLEQPSLLKWVPSETTYGVGPLVGPALVDA